MCMSVQCSCNISVTMEESIYNLVPKEQPQVVKGAIYRSKYPPDIIPTGTTFCHKTTSKPLVSNLNGQFEAGLQAHTSMGQTKTLGHLKNARRPSPEKFLRKQTGTMGNETLPPVQNFAYDCTHKKDPIPSQADKPVHGLKSNKNFIVSNAVENILGVAKKQEPEQDWLAKPTYGKVPEYLGKVKDNIAHQYKMIQNLHDQNNAQKQCLTEDEVKEIREGLKRKWDQINREYQNITHVRIVDTLGLKTKKEKYEKELVQIENDIKKLNKLYIFVEQ